MKIIRAQQTYRRICLRLESGGEEAFLVEPMARPVVIYLLDYRTPNSPLHNMNQQPLINVADLNVYRGRLQYQAGSREQLELEADLCSKRAIRSK